MECYPKFVKAYILAFEKRLIHAREKNLKIAKRFKTGEELFNFWINERPSEDADQTVMFE
jgi:hypothetical protein